MDFAGKICRTLKRAFIESLNLIFLLKPCLFCGTIRKNFFHHDRATIKKRRFNSKKIFFRRTFELMFKNFGSSLKCQRRILLSHEDEKNLFPGCHFFSIHCENLISLFESLLAHNFLLDSQKNRSFGKITWNVSANKKDRWHQEKA